MTTKLPKKKKSQCFRWVDLLAVCIAETQGQLSYRAILR